jgi:hypothetical protein
MRYFISIWMLLMSYPILAQDLALALPGGDILQPVSGCSLGSNENVTIRIFNFGPDLPAGSLFTVGYSINGGSPVNELVVLSSSLLSHSSFTYTFVTPANLSAPGNYILDAVVSLSGDINPTNNALTGRVVTNSAASIGGSVSADQTFCDVTNSGTLSLSGHVGDIIRWETSEDGGLTWRYVSQTTTQQNFLNLNTTTQYRAVVRNGTCAEATSSHATVTIGCPDLALAIPGGEILQPVSGCSLGSSENVTVRIFNFGRDLPAGSLFTVGYSINAGSPVNELVVLSSGLLSHSAFTYTFVTPANLSAPGNYILDAVVSLTGDMNPINDALTGHVVTHSAATVGGGVSPDQTICGVINSGTLSLSGHTGDIIRWETSEDGGVTWRYVSQTTSQQHFLNLQTTTQYRAVVKNGACAEAMSSDATVTIICGLPLTWTSFDARRAGDNVYLEWQTAQEVNTSNFVIERNAGDNLFQPIGTVAAQSPSGHYTFTDHHAPVTALQYRIKQVDLDNRYSFSPIRNIQDVSGPPSLVLRNNPVTTGILSFDMKGYPEGNAAITIYHMNGKKIQSAHVRLKPGNNTIRVPMHGAAAGIYFMTIQSGSLYSQKKFMLLR